MMDILQANTAPLVVTGARNKDGEATAVWKHDGLHDEVRVHYLQRALANSARGVDLAIQDLRAKCREHDALRRELDEVRPEMRCAEPVNRVIMVEDGAPDTTGNHVYEILRNERGGEIIIAHLIPKKGGGDAD